MRTRTATVAIASVAIVLLSQCSDDPPVVGEVISAPGTPEGSDSVFVGNVATFVADPAVSSEGHTLQYRFDFDAGGGHDYTSWYASPSASKSWNAPDTCDVKVQARCVKHAAAASPWSGAKVVAVIPGVATPPRPAGPVILGALQSGAYFVGGSMDTTNDVVEYRIDFDAAGAGDITDWQSPPNPQSEDGLTWTHSWAAPGTYVVKGQALSVARNLESPWSEGLTVTVGTPLVSTPEKPIGPTSPPPPPIGGVGDASIYCTGGATSIDGDPIEYQFSFTFTGNVPGSVTGLEETAWSGEPCTPQIVAYVDSEWTGEWEVRVRARSAIDTNKLSAWSEALVVTRGLEGDIPEIRFSTSIERIVGGVPMTFTRPYTPGAPDTVGMYRPFSITYHGVSPNGPIGAYMFFPQTSGVELEGQYRWTTDLSDTVRYFPNDDDPLVPSAQALDSGPFRLAARCFDSAGFQSIVDAGKLSTGICEVIVNFDPDTRMSRIENTFFVDGQEYWDVIDIADAIPDTVPYGSWIRLRYRGWDSPNDVLACSDPLNKCIRFQVQYSFQSDGSPPLSWSTSWLPYDPQDTDPYGLADSTSLNVGSGNYVLRVRAVDEEGRPDGTPYEVPVVANFPPTLDSSELVNYTGEHVADRGTIVWDWWNPSNYHGDPTDTLEFNGTDLEVVKTFFFDIRATGHDDPREPSGSGVKQWYYSFKRRGDATELPLGRSSTWVNGPAVNVLDDRVSFTFRYSFVDDPGGQNALDNLPEFLDTQLEFSVHGRDLAYEHAFSAFMFLNGYKTLINEYPDATTARMTETRTFSFRTMMMR